MNMGEMGMGAMGFGSQPAAQVIKPNKAAKTKKTKYRIWGQKWKKKKFKYRKNIENKLFLAFIRF